MSEIERILAVVAIIWAAHIPFVVPFVMAAMNHSDRKRQPAREKAPAAQPSVLARAS